METFACAQIWGPFFWMFVGIVVFLVLSVGAAFLGIFSAKIDL